jgi:hypothetical protein
MEKGSAVHDGHPPVMDFGNLGGGMSASENRMVNHKGKTLGGGSPKDTTGGKDIGKNAKNKMAGGGMLTKEISPSACKQSRNRDYK